MPQIFQVLRCFQCLVFQIHQCKKSNKWQCKLCGEKQSIKRHYGIGTGKDCRMHVQKLNIVRGNKEDANLNLSDSEYEDVANGIDNSANDLINNNKHLKNSKWDTYVDESEELLNIDSEPMYLGNKQVVLEIPDKKRGSKIQMHHKVHSANGKKSCQIESGNELSEIEADNANERLYYLKTNVNVATDIVDKAIATKRKLSVSRNSKWDTYMDTDKSQIEEKKNMSILPQEQKCLTIQTNTSMQNEIDSYNHINILTKNTMKNVSGTYYNTKNMQSLSTSCKEKENSSVSKWSDVSNNKNISVMYNSSIITEQTLREVKKTQTNIYSLCDDNDLDTILNV